MNHSLTIFEKYGLINASVSYSEIANAFLSTGYTSAAGNTYFNAIRLAEGILIKEDIGHGYARTFLNGLRIYSIKDQTLLIDKRFHVKYYSVSTVKLEAKGLLLKFLATAARKEGYSFDARQAGIMIDKILDNAFRTNQLEMLKQQTQKYLIG